MMSDSRKPPIGQPSSSATSTALVCAGLATLVLLVYAEVGNFPFVDLDDDIHVFNNSHISTGVTPENVVWDFTIHGPGQWHPLAHLSHQLVYRYFGAGPRAHHMVNLVLHVASVVLLLLALRRMTGQLWPSAFVAALFGLHPLQVESVAWVCERRDVLCGFFWMLTLLAYAAYAERGGWWRYLAVILSCAAALMSKPMAVTLPCVLLLLDLWPLRRGGTGESPAGNGKACAASPRSWMRLVLEKVPLLCLSAIASVLTVLCHSEAVVSLSAIPFRIRLANGLIAYVVYLRKLVWPVDLAVWYPHPYKQPDFQLWFFACSAILAAVFLLAITVLVVYQIRRRPYLAVGWFWYLGVLVPVSGLFQTGAQAYADRFTYLPLIGIYMAIAWTGEEMVTRWRSARSSVRLLTPALLVACLTITSLQVSTWRDSRALYEHALLVTSNNAMIHYNLGRILLDRNEPVDAQEHLMATLRIWPGHLESHICLADALRLQGRFADAIEQCQQALLLRPVQRDAHYLWGNTLRDMRRFSEAATQFQEALIVDPQFAKAHNNLGNVLQQLKQFDEAIRHYKAALVLMPNSVETHNNLGNALAQQGRYQEARQQFQRALELKPDFTPARDGLRQVDALLQRPSTLQGS